MLTRIKEWVWGVVPEPVVAASIRFKEFIRETLKDYRGANYRSCFAVYMIDFDWKVEATEAVKANIIEQVCARTFIKIRPIDTAMVLEEHRLGFIVRALNGGPTAVRVGSRILQQMKAPVTVDGRSYPLSPIMSIVIPVATKDTEESVYNDLLTALQGAKEDGSKRMVLSAAKKEFHG